MVCMAPSARGDQVKEFFESFHVVVERTGGCALLAALPFMLVAAAYGGLQSVGRSLWSRGTQIKADAWAREILDRPIDSVDPVVRKVAENHFRYKLL